MLNIRPDGGHHRPNPPSDEPAGKPGHVDKSNTTANNGAAPIKAKPGGAPAPQGTQSHVVKRGDTVESIAKQHNITPSQLFDLNPNVDPGKQKPTLAQARDHWSPDYLEDVKTVIVPDQTMQSTVEQSLKGAQTLVESLRAYGIELLGGAGQANAKTPPPDPEADAARILEVGRQSGRDDYDARLKAYADANANATPEYREQLLAEILKKDGNALNSWLEPERINDAVDSGKISVGDRSSIAESLMTGYVNGTVPADQVESFFDSVVESTRSAIGLGGSYSFQENANAAAEMMDFLDSAPSTPETRAFREQYAQHLVDKYTLNDESVDNGPRYSAASLAALLVSGDENHPEIAQQFLSRLDQKGQLNEFISAAANGSTNYSKDFLAPHIEGNPDYTIDDVSLPDSVASLLNSVALSSGSATDELVVKLAHLPGDNDRLFRNSPDRTSAMTNLFNLHSDAILDDLTNPSGMPEPNGEGIQPEFKDRAHDLGALIKLIEGSGETWKIGQARERLVEYAAGLKNDIASATTAEQGFEAGRRLGFLGAAVTESISQGFREYAETQEQKKALVGFMLDLAVSAIPFGALTGKLDDAIGEKVGEWLAKGLSQDALKDALTGFSGNVIDSATGALTDAAKNHILNNLDADDIDKLIVKLQDSNEFIQGTLFADLPAPGYEPGEGGRSDTLRDVQGAYDIALIWLNR